MEEKFKILTVEQARNNIYSVVSDSNIGGVVYTEEIATPPCVVVVQNSDSFFLKAFAPRRNILEKLSGNLVNKFDNTNYEVERASDVYYWNSKKNTLVLEFKITPIC